MSTYYLYSAVVGFLAGTALPFLGLPASVSAAFALLISAGLLLLLWLEEDFSLSVVLVILLLALAGGSLRAGSALDGADERVFDRLLETSVVAKGVVTNLPELRENGQNLTVTLSQVMGSEEERTIKGASRAVVYAPAFPALQYGDRLRLTGKLTKPTAFQTDTGRFFPYPQYLARESVFYELSRPQITILESGAANSILGWMADLRRNLLTSINENIPDPHAALTGGVLLGAADALGERVQESFRESGIVHVVVLSGYHVTVITVALGAILAAAGLSLLSSSILSGLGVVFFALLVGMTPTVVRASIMAIIALVARIFSRQYVATRGLILAVIAMVMVNPHILLYDPSFQLSVMATAGLVSFGDVVYGWLSAIPRRFGIREMATATITAQIAVTPLLLYYTGMFSVVSLIANLLVLPVIPVLMTVGLLTAVVGLLSQTFTLPFAGMAYGVSEYIFTVVDWLTSLSFSTLSTGNISLLAVFFAYMLLASFFWVAQNRYRLSQDKNL
ncbi:MAG: ComEC/Rec2 family competence protein [Candidatus Paceibacterota bacterium]